MNRQDQTQLIGTIGETEPIQFAPSVSPNQAGHELFSLSSARSEYFLMGRVLRERMIDRVASQGALEVLYMRGMMQLF